MLTIMQSNEVITSNGGFSFVERILSHNSQMKNWDILIPARYNVKFSTSSIVQCAVGIMAAGNCNYADIEKYQNDSLFRRLSGGNVPSQESFRQRLEAIAENEWKTYLDACVSEMLAKTPLTRIEVCGEKLIPLDIDVSVLEDTSSKREGVSNSYHKVNGYAPIFCYAGKEGMMVANELRPGSQHCEKNAVPFLTRCVSIMNAAGYASNELLVRVDSGHDSADFLKKLSELGVKFQVKRNLRRESQGQLCDTIRSYETPEEVRLGKVIYRGIRSDKTPAGFEKFNGFMVIEATERTIESKGQKLLIPEVEVDSWWTNLPCSVRECVELYHDHGTSEQFHSELKSDMGIELLPSGKMKTNSLFLGLAALAFNCLRMIGIHVLCIEQKSSARRTSQQRYRLRTILLDYIKVGAKIVKHAGKVILKLGCNCFNFATFKEVFARC